VQEAARHLPEGRGLRILEVGAGTGGLSSHVLPLLERGLHTYIFSDVSAGFFRARCRSSPPSGSRVQDFRSRKTRIEQDLAAESFDLVIGTNVLHAVSDVRATLGHLRDLLAPGGSLVFMDTATPQLWTETVFGLTSGWWRFTDRELRPHQPLLERAQWERVCKTWASAKQHRCPASSGPLAAKARLACSRARRGLPLLRDHFGRAAGGKILAHLRRCRRPRRSTRDATPRRRCALPRGASRPGIRDDRNGLSHSHRSPPEFLGAMRHAATRTDGAELRRESIAEAGGIGEDEPGFSAGGSAEVIAAGAEAHALRASKPIWPSPPVGPMRRAAMLFR